MRLRNVFFLFLTSFLLTGCFDLVEDVSIRNDGSGSFLFLANLSQSKLKLKTLMALDSMDGLKIPSVMEIKRDLEKATRILSASEGISKVENSSNFDDFIFSMHFEFKNITCLNNALTNLSAAFTPPGRTPPASSFGFDSKSFSRTNEYDGKREMKRIPAKDLALIGSASMTCIYHFDKTVSQFSNADARLSKNKKAVMLKLPVTDLMNGSKHISNTIKFQDE